MKKSEWFVVGACVAVAAAVFLLIPEEVMARAGGGGGGGGGRGGLLTIILTPFVLIYCAIVSLKIRKKNLQCRELLKKLEKTDPVWDRRFMRTRVEQAFFSIQKAWMDRDQDSAREYMSDRLYAKHKMQTDAMIERGEKNILQSINLVEALIVEVVDYEDDAMDSFVAAIDGSMYDFTENEITHKIIKGSSTEIESFKELWRFIRSGDTWVVDEISQEVNLSGLDQLRAFSQVKVPPAE